MKLKPHPVENNTSSGNPTLASIVGRIFIVTFGRLFVVRPGHDWQVKQRASVKWSRGDISLFKHSLSLIKLISRSTNSLFATDKKFQFSQQT